MKICKNIRCKTAMSDQVIFCPKCGSLNGVIDDAVSPAIDNDQVTPTLETPSTTFTPTAPPIFSTNEYHCVNKNPKNSLDDDRMSTQERGCDYRYVLEIAFEEAIFGADVTINIPYQLPCKECYTKNNQSNSATSTCSACNGTGYVEITRDFQVIVPPGVIEGQRILFEGGGEISHHHGPSGDLYVEINIQPDSIFSREGSDLHCVVTIDSQVAINGGKYYLKTPMGDMNIIIPLASKDGQLLRLKGRGIKHPNSDERGDLIAHLKVEEDAGLLDKVKRFFDNIGH